MTVINSLQYYKNRFEEMGYTVDIHNCGTMLTIYTNEKIEVIDGWLYGLAIEIREVFRHNAVDENRNVRFDIFKWNGTVSQRVSKDKIRCRIDSSDNIKEKRIAKIIELYNQAEK